MRPIHVVLTGPRAVGKSTIGLEVARRLEMRFVDLDEMVLDRFSESSVVDVWNAHGEDAWREMECLVLGDLLREPSLVLALGGGVPTIPLAVEQLNAARQRDAAVIIWLQADPDELASRLESSTGDRPSLTGRTPAEEIAEISRARASSYRMVSDITLDVGAMEVSQVVDSVLAVLK